MAMREEHGQWQPIISSDVTPKLGQLHKCDVFSYPNITQNIFGNAGVQSWTSIFDPDYCHVTLRSLIEEFQNTGSRYLMVGDSSMSTTTSTFKYPIGQFEHQTANNQLEPHLKDVKNTDSLIFGQMFKRCPDAHIP